MNNLGRRSKKNLKNLTPEISVVIGMAIARSKVDFTIIDGFRTTAKQKEKFDNKKSKCDGTKIKSRHQSGDAIDFIPYPFDNNWKNTEQFVKVWNELQFCAKHLGFKVGNFITWDSGHFELRR